MVVTNPVGSVPSTEFNLSVGHLDFTALGPGFLDYGFAPLPPPDPTQDFIPEIFALQSQADGKILAVGPLFPGWWIEKTLGRFNYDGSLDASFNAATNATRIALAPDGRIIAAGNGFVARLMPDGSLDPSFKAAVRQGWPLDVLLDPAGRVWLGVEGEAGDGHPEGQSFQVFRFNPDGTSDHSFQPKLGLAVEDLRISLAPDGRLVVWGSVFFRLNADGSRDTSFHPLVDAAVDALAVQPDGKMVVASYGRIVRLNPDGSFDDSFALDSQATYSNGTVSQVAIQPGGKIIVAGGFDHIAGATRRSVALLNTDGSLDTSFDLGPGLMDDASSYLVYPEALAVEVNGDILVGGLFARAQGAAVNSFVRINGGLSGGLITSYKPAEGILSFVTRPGNTHTLEVSEDLIHWSSLVTKTALAPTLDFNLSPPTEKRQLFYRARRTAP